MTNCGSREWSNFFVAKREEQRRGRMNGHQRRTNFSCTELTFSLALFLHTKKLGLNWPIYQLNDRYPWNFKFDQRRSYSFKNKVHTAYHFMVVIQLNRNQRNNEIHIIILNRCCTFLRLRNYPYWSTLPKFFVCNCSWHLKSSHPLQLHLHHLHHPHILGSFFLLFVIPKCVIIVRRKDDDKDFLGEWRQRVIRNTQK